MISQIILKYDIQARRCAQILCSRMWFTQSETAPLCPGLFFYIHRFWQSLFGSCPSFPKTGILLFSEMPVILSLEDHCNRFPQKRPHTTKYVRKGSYRHYRYGRRGGLCSFWDFFFSFPSKCHLYQKILGYERHLATRMQQLKMATYFDEILGEMLLKVELSHYTFIVFIVCFSNLLDIPNFLFGLHSFLIFWRTFCLQTQWRKELQCRHQTSWSERFFWSTKD